jgi:pimeloyl-ACP methyl ester carboxylesterase
MDAGIANGARVVAPNLVRTRDGVDLFYRDWGSGKPVLFVAGWSLPSDSWNYQMLALREHGMRVIAFDRRGHGRSSDPGRGYDFDTLAADIAAVIEALDLSGVTLVGHSMGCNEIVRYLSRHGRARVERAALLGTMTPCVSRRADNPGGLDPALFEYFRREQLMKDFPKWVDDNMTPFVLEETPAGMKAWLRQMAFTASAHALYECNLALTTSDLRPDLPLIDVPVLVIAGERDASAPLALAARPTVELLPDARLKVYAGAPHGMFITHLQQVNADLLEFIGAGAAQSKR